MSVLGFIGIGALVVGAVGSGFGFYNYCSKEDERIQAKINDIKLRIDTLDKTITHFSNVKIKLENGMGYLNSSKSDFANGGHVYNDIPLANSEFNSCINAIKNSISNIDNLLKDSESEKLDLEKEKAELEAKL